MCYSAQVEADYRKYVHMFGAQMSIREFARLYWERAEGSKANVPKAMDDAFFNPQTDEERKVKACIEKFNAAQLTKLEQELRIAMDKIEWIRGRLDDVQRTEPKARD